MSIYLHFYPEKFPDPDVFYHFRHAAIYRAGGLFAADFPWLPYSVISKFSSDIWYGFHVLLVPFSWVDDPDLGVRLAGTFVTLAFLATVYLACVSLEIKSAVFWPFFLLCSSAFLLHRLAMLRPQVLSLGLAVLLLAYLAAGGVRQAFLTVFVSTFFHLSLFFVSLIVFGVFAAIKWLSEKIFSWREGLAVVAGLVCGWLLRPDPWGAAEIAYVQVFQFTFEKLAGVPLDFGAELLPLQLKLSSNYLAFTLLLFLTLLYVGWRFFTGKAVVTAPVRTLLLTSALLSLLFFVMAVFFARRAYDLCSAFGVVSIALVYSHFLYGQKWVRIAGLALFVFLVGYGVPLRNRVLAIGWDIQRERESARWLESNSKPGDIVFNARWEYFPGLFLWNTKNFYTSGMDPIFQYAYDARLYTAGIDLASAKNSPLLCATGACENINSQPHYGVIKEKYKARYVYLHKGADPALYLSLLGDQRFFLGYENASSAVFEVR